VLRELEPFQDNEAAARPYKPQKEPTMHRVAVLSVCLIAIAMGGTRVDGSGPRPRIINADLVFTDSGTMVRSDGFLTTACDNGSGNPSRYCAASSSDIGPECSRISYATIDGDYSFRTRTSDPSCLLPPGTQRQAVLDFTDKVSVPSCAPIVKVEGGISRQLDPCGANTVDDVRIEAEHLFAVASGGSTKVTIYLALHSPPTANTTHFIVEYQQPLLVTVNGGTRTAATVGAGVANLYDIAFNKTRSKMTQTLIGVYNLPASFTAGAIP
jgi:hypothetical protein